VKGHNVMTKAAKQPATPRFPSKRVKCRYCKCAFNTPPTYNGSRMKFCCEKHQKAFDKEGEKPIDVILRKQERRMREIAREEIAARESHLACIAGHEGRGQYIVTPPSNPSAPAPGSAR
jgi:hypothetical protein